MSWFSQPRQLWWLRLSFDHQLDQQQVRQFLLNLLGSPQLGLVVFETEASKQQLVYRIGTQHPGQINRLLLAHLSSVTVQRELRPGYVGGQAWTVRANAVDRPLATDQPEASSAGLLGALAVRDKSIAVISWCSAAAWDLDALPARRWPSLATPAVNG